MYPHTEETLFIILSWTGKTMILLLCLATALDSLSFLIHLDKSIKEGLQVKFSFVMCSFFQYPFPLQNSSAWILYLFLNSDCNLVNWGCFVGITLMQFFWQNSLSLNLFFSLQWKGLKDKVLMKGELQASNPKLKWCKMSLYFFSSVIKGH